MKIYAIEMDFDNGEEYGCHDYDHHILSCYVDYQHAIRAFEAINPQDILDVCGFMSSDDAAEYELCDDAVTWLSSYQHHKLYCHSRSCFAYYIKEIDVIED